jgi:hypothetical protein
VFDIAQSFFECVGSVAGTVVGQYFSYLDPQFGEVRVGVDPERGSGLFAFIGQQLAIGQP